MDIAAADCLLAERRGAIAWITLNHPHTRNALSVAMMTAIEAALAQARDARAVVIAGTGPGFCGGHDLKEMRANLQSRGVKFDERVLPRLNMTQLFYLDPDGISVECNFDAAETEVQGAKGY